MPKHLRPNGEANPLAKYFRVPGVQVQLPTGGAYMPEGTIDLTLNGEVQVYPMRAADEMLLKSPDALMSGYAIEKLLESCVPSIKAPRLVSSPDLDIILLAIRAATYGEMMEMTPVCPECSTTNQAAINLAAIMSTMTVIEPAISVRLSDEVVAYLRPHNMANATRLGIMSFDETRKVQAIDEADVDKRRTQINESMQKISKVATEIMADCVARVVVPDDEVTDRHMISEFLENVSKDWTDKLQEKLNDINGRGIDKSYQVTCSKCKHPWTAQIEFDPATFFASAS